MSNADDKISFSSLDRDVLIEALAPQKGASEFHALIFRASAIDCLMEVNEKVSAIVLRNGITIPVALPYQKLKQSVYAPDFKDGPILNLLNETGHAAKDILVPGLSDEFNDKAGLVIRATLRKLGTNETVRMDFSEAAMLSYAPDSNTRSKTSHSVLVKFTPETNVPLNTQTAHIDMPYEDFMTYLDEAKKKGLKTLDLCTTFINNPKKYGFDPL